MRRLTLAATLSLAAALPVSAQDAAPPAVAPGARVRLAAPAVDGIYYVLSATPDTLVVQRDPSAPVERVAVAALHRLDVSRGRRSTVGGFRRGAVIGAVAGALLGVASGLDSGDDPPSGWFSMTAEEKALGGGLIVGLGGGAIGGVIGAFVPGEQWERVATTPRVAVVAPPVGRGVGVRLAGAF